MLELSKNNTHWILQVLNGGVIGGTVSELTGGRFIDGFSSGLITAGLNHAMHSLVESDGGDPPSKEEIKIWLAGEFLEGRMTQREYINAIALVDGGSWGLFQQVFQNNKLDIALTFFPAGKLTMLGRYFASLQQLNGVGEVIATGTKIKDIERLIAVYGGTVSKWTKVVSKTTYAGRDGFKFSTHWYEMNGIKYEIKTVIGR